MLKQSIVRFCQGCKDKEAGQSACNTRPKTIDKAMEHIRWYQYTHQAMYRSNRAKDTKKAGDYERVSRTSLNQERHLSSNDDWEKERDYLSVSATSENNRWGQDGQRQDFRRSQNRNNEDSIRLKALEDNMALVLSGLEKMVVEVNKLSNRRASRSPSPNNRSCFFCEEEGHLLKDCPLYKEKLEKEKHVSFSDDLNQSVSDNKAKARPGQ